jgi:alpha-tubulin suppressor-like RCC1 family protein
MLDASIDPDSASLDTALSDAPVLVCTGIMDGTACDDDNVCTVYDSCQSGTCTGTSNEGAVCGDGRKFCHASECQSGCLIEGDFYAEEATNPNDDCQVCDLSKSIIRWSLSSSNTCRPTAITAGGGHTCAIVHGGVFCWGENTSGELGNGKQQNSNRPVQVKGLTSGVTALSAGLQHTCAIVNGSVWCWGNNAKGQLGNGLSTVSNHPEPLQVPGLATGATLIAAGDTHTCAALTRGAMCWGYNGGLPTPVASFANVTVVSLAAATDFSCAMGPDSPSPRSEGTMYYWENKELVAGNVPLMEWFTGSAIFAAGNRGCAIHEDDFKLRCWSYDTWTQSNVFSSGVATAALSPTHGCAVVTGSAQCWGTNSHGQLGNDHTSNSRTPVTAIGLTANVTGIAVGTDHSCALVQGEVRCWGANASGQLGTETVEEHHTPAPPVQFIF